MQWLDSFLVSRKRKRLTREESLNARPVRNPEVEWTERDGEVLLRVPLPKGKWMPILKSVSGAPQRERKVQLDELGSYVWARCDGERTVLSICEALCDDYKLSYREALVSLTTYLRQLGKRGLVGFALDKDVLATRGVLKEGGAGAEKTQEAAAGGENDPDARGAGTGEALG